MNTAELKRFLLAVEQDNPDLPATYTYKDAQGNAIFTVTVDTPVKLLSERRMAFGRLNKSLDVSSFGPGGLCPRCNGSGRA